VSLDERDNDPVRFWRYVAGALETAGVDLDTGYLSLLRPPQPAPIEAVLIRLLNTLSARPDDIILVLDDYHAIDNEEIHRGVAFCLEHLPPCLHLAISTRADPPLPLARLRADGRIIEVRIEELRFRREEAAVFLNDIMGLELAPEEIEALGIRTEGWIAGLQLAGLSLQGQSRETTSDFITSFAGSHRHVVDYLTDEVLARLPESVNAFLLHTSILDRLSASLCAFVMDGETGVEAIAASRELLEELERSNLFLVPLDEEREWYRYHHLFAEALYHRFQRLEPDRVGEARMRASRWFEQYGLLQAAAEYALDAAEFERAAGLIERMQSTELSSFGTATVSRLLDRVPDEVMSRHPTLCIVKAWFLLDARHLEQGERWLDAAARALDNRAISDDTANLRGEIAAARAFAASFWGDAGEVVARTEEALRNLDRENFLTQGRTLLALGRAYIGQGELARAAESFDEAAVTLRRTGNAAAVLRAMFGQAHLERAQGHLRRAIVTCREAIAWSAERGHPYPGVGIAYLDLADMTREQNDLDAASHLAEEGAAFCQQMDYDLDAKLYPGYVLARIEQAHGRLDVALEIFRETEELLQIAEPARSRALWQEHEALLWVQLGNLAAASACAERAVQEKSREAIPVPSISFTLPSLFFTPRYKSVLLTPIEVMIAQGRATGDPDLLQRALDLLDDRGRAVGTADPFWLQIRAIVLQALAHHALGDVARARVSLEQALTLGQPERYVRLFADLGAPMADLLRAVPVDDAMREYVAVILSAMHPTQ
jgi:LuxR family maltose regulon positive regulatory protein